MPVLGSSTSGSTAQGSMGLGYAVPAGWGTAWRTARNNSAAARSEAVIFGDSTTWGSQANYSWVQRLRDRSVAAGYADGGKGRFGGNEGTIVYDSPEINGTVSNGWTWVQDAAYTDILAGESYSSNTSGEVLTVQGRIVGSGGVCRLWYQDRTTGTFTYSMDGAAATTVTCGATGNPKFVWITGLAAGTHTLTITNTSANFQIVAVDFMNATGLVYHKNARVGAEMLHWFDPHGRFAAWTARRDAYAQAVLGLTVGNGGNNLSWQQTVAATTGTPSVSLAILHLGFNDLTGMVPPWDSSVTYSTNNRVLYGGTVYKAVAGSSNVVPPGNTGSWAQSDLLATTNNDLDNYSEGIHLFCRLAQAAGADPLVISGEYLMNSSGAYKVGGRIARTTRDTALACGAAWCDFMVPALGKPNAITGQASVNNPHLNKPGYVAQADFLWDKVLSL